MSLRHNISAIDLRSISARALINSKKESARAAGYISLLGIRATGIQQKVGSLSGGNQQKVLIGKLLSVEPRILFMDEPTRGIDVGAKSEIHKLLRDLAQKGVGVVVISSELPEVIGLCDRVLVMHEGTEPGNPEGTRDHGRSGHPPRVRASEEAGRDRMEPAHTTPKADVARDFPAAPGAG